MPSRILVTVYACSGSVMGSVPEFPVSSTQIRELVKKNGAKSISAFVSPEVTDYIMENGLYS